MLRIERKKSDRAGKCILHRIADIPGGVTVSTKSLGGSVLVEGTPIGKGSNGLFEVVKTAQILKNAGDSDTSYEVDKKNHFKEGDTFAVTAANGKKIMTIDRSDSSRDVISLEATLGVAISKGDCAFESAGATKKFKVSPIAIVGSKMDVKAGDNLFVDAWVHAVVREEGAPAVTEKMKEALKSVSYV